MRRNVIKQRLADGDKIIGTMLQELRTPAMAQVLKAVGFDFFMIDMEHGSFNLESATEIIRVGRILDMCPLVRAPSPEYHLIAKVLDQGAMGVMMPRIETREHVETLVESMKYPPLGKRGCSSDAPHSEYSFGSLSEFIDINNQDTLVITQIERKVAIENIDDLLAVPGVDVALIGPEDLSVSMGVPGDTSHPLVEEAIEKVMEAANRHNVVPAIHMGGAEPLIGWLGKGMRMVMYSSDLGFIMEASEKGLNQIRASL